MTVHERIKRIAHIIGVPYSSISLLINSTMGKSNKTISEKLEILEKEYDI